MKIQEKLEILQRDHMGEWLKMRRIVEDELSERQAMFCVCGRLATGLHEMNCSRFRNKVTAETVKRLAHLLKTEKKKFRYLVYREDGRKQNVESDGKTLDLEMLQKLVGGNIELVRGKIGNDDRLFIVDEEGLIKSRKPNPFLPQFVGTVIVTSLDGVK